jgi:hypothetical protein
MKKIVSYSLYNQRPKDCINAVINCMLIPKVYPDWVARFYIDDTIPKAIDELLQSFEHVEIVRMPRGTGSERMLWRFLPCSDDSYDQVMISRDADSWVSMREKVCVDAWLASNKNFHKIIGHCYHTDPKVKIMGGLWGCRNYILPKMKEEVEKFMNAGQTYDQGMLASVIYPNILHDMICHYDDPSYNNKGERVYGQPEEQGSAFPIPQYQEWDEPIPGLSFREANKLNGFHCAHCNKTHDVLIGGITEHIPPRAMEVVRNYAAKKNISLDGCPGF